VAVGSAYASISIASPAFAEKQLPIDSSSVYFIKLIFRRSQVQTVHIQLNRIEDCLSRGSKCKI
jgi:hypothetical protein